MARAISYIILAILLIFFGILLQGSVLRYCKTLMHGGHLAVSDGETISEGYMLVAPYYASNFYEEAGEVDLIDTSGRIVHTWRTSHPVLAARLQDNGRLIVAMTPPADLLSYPGGGTTGLLHELDWDGNVLWEYEDENMTHDFELLPDGRIAYLVWDKAPLSFANGIRGGFSPVSGSDVWTNAIVIVDRAKNEVWKWHMHDHVDPRSYELNSYTPRSDWAHVNSIRYTSNNPITHTPAFLISVRHISTVFLIDVDTGSVIWQSPRGMFSMQHDATFLENGRILVFDNGFLKQQLRPYYWSRVVEVDLLSNEVVWQFDGGKTGTEKAQFATSIMGGAQRLSNGNTFITLSTMGRMFEVTPDKRVVWDYVQNFPDEEGRKRIVFKAEKYESTDSWGALTEKLPYALNLFCEI